MAGGTKGEGEEICTLPRENDCWRPGSRTLSSKMNSNIAGDSDGRELASKECWAEYPRLTDGCVS